MTELKALFCGGIASLCLAFGFAWDLAVDVALCSLLLCPSTVMRLVNIILQCFVACSLCIDVEDGSRHGRVKSVMCLICSMMRFGLLLL